MNLSATGQDFRWAAVLVFAAWLPVFAPTGAHAAEPELVWRSTAPLPDPIGFAGAFAGVSGNALIVAGGANFPGKMPWDGGVKVWHDDLFVLEHPAGTWRTGYKLPRVAAYGVSVTIPDGVLCIGGCDTSRHLTNVFVLKWDGQKVHCKEFPPLPMPIANSCGALVGEEIYLAGGTDTPEATIALKRFFRLRLRPQPRWEELGPWPGPARMLATAASADGSFLLMGGTDLSPAADGMPRRHYLADAYRFRPARGWERLEDMPRPAVAAASPAPAIGRRVLVVSGDDGTLVNFEPKNRHPGFPKGIQCYDIGSGHWSVVGETPVPRATLPTTHWNGMWVFPSGEVKPGVRSPEVWTLQRKQRD